MADKKKRKQIKSKRLLPYRPNVCMFVINKRGEIFLGERAGESGVWQLPQGGVESELSLEKNVVRELVEELGAPRSTFRIVKKLRAKYRYLWRTPPDYARDRWRGQSQTFWLVEYLGTDRQITLGGDPQEFSDWVWCAPSLFSEIAEKKRMAGYSAPFKEVLQHIRTTSKQVTNSKKRRKTRT